MRRGLGVALTTCSTAICLATCALWWRTASRPDATHVWFERSGELFALRATVGQLAWVVPPPPVGSAAEGAAAAGWVARLDTFGRLAGSPEPHIPEGEGGPSPRVDALDACFPCATHYFSELADRRRRDDPRQLANRRP
jgi:hypothetical protein